MPRPVTPEAMIRAIRRAEETLRWAGSQLTVNGWVRLQLLQQAETLRRLLDRIDDKK